MGGERRLFSQVGGNNDNEWISRLSESLLAQYPNVIGNVYQGIAPR